MDKIAIIIPIFNIRKRGFYRLDFLLYSLKQQTNVPEIIVSDGSFRNDFFEIKAICDKHKVKLIHKDMKEFNKPILLNRGIKESTSDWICCTDVDYVFRKDFCEMLLKNAKKDRFIVKEVMMSPQRSVLQKQIDDWEFPDIYKNHYGKKADGACQFGHRDWFYDCGGYDERMIGWCAMDNQMTLRVGLAKLELYWMLDSEIIHIWHLPEKGKKARDLAHIKNNFILLKNTNHYKLNFLSR